MDKPDFEKIIDEVRAYASSRSELSKMQAVEKSSELIGAMTSRLVLLLLTLIVFFFLSIGIALLISKFLGSYYAGFMVMAGCYLLLLLLFYLKREKWMINPVTNQVIRSFYKNDEEED